MYGYNDRLLKVKKKEENTSPVKGGGCICSYSPTGGVGKAR